MIGGILAWINRRGGCAKRSKEQKSDFEDYGLGDFPHHRNQNAMAAAAVPATAAAVNPVSPTIPRMNEQGNYYNEDPNYNYHNAGYNGGYPEDYNNMQHQGYYYPQLQQQHDAGYYEDGNYYYDNNSSPTYTNAAYPPQQQQPYMNTAPYNSPHPENYNNPGVYKPDDVAHTANDTPHK